MKILIAEDESLTAQRILKMTTDLLGDSVEFILVDTVADTISYLENDPPDLLLLDVHLADGSSLELFKKIKVEVPIIFTTAYDKYAVKAFQLSAVDYLLKPVNKEDLEKALNKWKRLDATPPIDYAELAKAIGRNTTKRFMSRVGQQLHVIEDHEIAFVQTEDRLTLLVTTNGKRFPMDQSLDSLERELDADQFFRINRQFIINRKAIKELHTYSKSRVKLILEPAAPSETIVSTERSAIFKEWLVSAI